MKKYLNAILFFSLLASGCVRQNQINFNSSEAFFSSLNDKERKIYKKNKIEKKEKEIVKKSILLTLSSYENQLKEKFGLEEFKILKIFKNPNLKIKHGKIKNLQFHFKFCHLDLFFLQKDNVYEFKHFDIRPSSMKSNLNKKECVKELNNKFILIHDPK